MFTNKITVIVLVLVVLVHLSYPTFDRCDVRASGRHVYREARNPIFITIYPFTRSTNSPLIFAAKTLPKWQVNLSTCMKPINIQWGLSVQGYTVSVHF